MKNYKYKTIIFSILSIFSLNGQEYEYINNDSYTQYNKSYIDRIDRQEEYIFNKENTINYNNIKRNESSFGFNSNNKGIEIGKDDKETFFKVYKRKFK